MTLQTDQKLRIGELLIERGVLTAEQVAQILDEQKKTSKPFGDIAEREFSISPETIENVWLEQYLNYSTQIDLRDHPSCDEALEMLSKRQAWQFRMLPIEFEGEHLVIATSKASLRKAINFAARRIGMPVMFLVACDKQLEESLEHYYPWPAMHRQHSQ